MAVDIAPKTPVAEGDPPFWWGNRRDWFPGGRGVKGDIYRQSNSRRAPDLGRRTYFFGEGTGGAMIRRVYSVSTFSKKTP
jgi:hypothetical protein